MAGKGFAHSRMGRFAGLFCIVLLLLILQACATRQGRMREAEILYRQGQILLSEGRSEEAVAHFEKSLALTRENDYPAGTAHNLNELAIHQTARGEYDTARKMFGEALEIYRQEKMAPEVSKVLNNLALTFVRQGNLSQAVKEYTRLLQWDRATGNRLGEGITLYNMGLLLEGERRQEARELFRQALVIFEELGSEKYLQAVRAKMAR